MPAEVYSDNAAEFKAAFSGLHWLADTCTPHRKQTNGIAERQIRRVREGAGSALVQAGTDPIWWAEASQCFCFLRVVVDALHPDEKTAYERRWGHAFAGPIIPFGASVDFLPASKEDRAAVHAVGAKTIPGIFAGYHQKVGGQWSGDLYVVSLADIRGNVNHKPHCKRIQAPNVYVNKKKGTEKRTQTKVFFSQSNR